MIEPIHSLAFSMQANRGVYAVLFGSGLSRSARIPTGWEITLDLVRRLAAVGGEECGADPSAWYRGKFDKEPDYSELLDALAKTPAERQQLLRQYWEPTEQEREEGAKQPTQAHRAIADLVAKGFVRVIVTTNFDRLMELALLDVGVTPTVLSSSDHVHGAMPLIHTQCCVFKVHGDYLDTRIRNTPEELSGYPAEFDTLLDRIFDEFGLIVCGWSADWDEALRRAIFRAPSRRFATYWAVRGEPSDAARQLIEHRGAQVVSITDADSFFSTVHRQVEALEEFARPHPLSTAAAVAALKRYMSEPRYRIQHADLVEGEVEHVLSEIGHDKFPVQGGPNPDATHFNHRVKAYEAAMTTLVAM
ncbi:SIR2 family protein [Chromobacterium amazonense]|uniref:SIR2 family protein n=1 Tax=Chromobacterium amazonense TaxID=1382803 RepID=A0ABU8UY90_9NEIS|nr:SIR2 family protein [Chromobacterium amazonense]MDQ4541156.1 SIR2 family protein [Chromobacterium amazonense]